MNLWRLLPTLLKCVFLPLILFASASATERECARLLLPSEATLDADSLSAQFRELALGGLLISQKDPHLRERALVLPNGGLCSSTCGANVLHAGLAYLKRDTQYFLQRSDEAIERLVKKVWSLYHHDARIGLDFKKLAPALNAIARELGVHLMARRRPVTEEYHYGIAHLQPKSDTIVIVAVRVNESKAHAMVITGFDAAADRVQFVDPNHSDRVYEGAVRYVTDSAMGYPTLQIEMPASFGKHEVAGTMIDLIQVRVMNKDAPIITEIRRGSKP